MSETCAAVPAISVIVCTRDRPASLDRCLEAFAAQRYPHHEIIVVGNASSDPATERIAIRRANRYLLESNAGLSNARNAGIAAAAHDIIAFTDDDTEPDAGWLDGIAAAFADPTVSVVTGRVLPAELETRAQRLFEYACGGMSKGDLPFTIRRESITPLHAITVERFGVGANMGFRREVFDAIGGFDPDLGAGSAGRACEDLDILHRAIVAGFALRYTPAATVRHHHRRSMAELERQLVDGSLGHLRYLEKCARSRTTPAWAVRMCLAASFARSVARVGASVVRRERVPVAIRWRQLRATTGDRR